MTDGFFRHIIYGPCHAKTCLMSYANNEGADQPAHPHSSLISTFVANNEGADQPAHSHSLISTFVVRCLDSTTPLVVILKISRLQLASLAKRTGLNRTWSKIHEGTFLHDVTHTSFLWKQFSIHLQFVCSYTSKLKKLT